MSVRMDKINQEIRKQIMEVIQREIDDPTLEFLSITSVRTTSDLQECRIYFSMLQDDKYPQAKETLEKMKGFIRSSLAKKIRLKVLPQLVFFPDDSIKYSVDIYRKIEEIKAQDAQKRSKKSD
ncbi:MAG: 30S ribosome-binding factor RbfA [Candidatus Omnitrophica bacterium]|nr:30S ribosome-binding factor RbfA [Candidatus Omnitrophota bacterium]